MDALPPPRPSSKIVKVFNYISEENFANLTASCNLVGAIFNVIMMMKLYISKTSQYAMSFFHIYLQEARQKMPPRLNLDQFTPS